MQQDSFINVLPCCIKLAFQIIAWARCKVKQRSTLRVVCYPPDGMSSVRCLVVQMHKA